MSTGQDTAIGNGTVVTDRGVQAGPHRRRGPPPLHRPGRRPARRIRPQLVELRGALASSRGANRRHGRGIDGIERMRLVRDDITVRVADLLNRIETRLFVVLVLHSGVPRTGDEVAAFTR